jgi:hypothetical protein
MTQPTAQQPASGRGEPDRVAGRSVGFRALAHVNGHHRPLFFRNGHVLKRWPQLSEKIAHAVGAQRCGWRDHVSRSRRYERFYDLLFGRNGPTSSRSTRSPSTGQDIRDLPLHERKRRLARIMPWVDSRLMNSSRAAANASSNSPASVVSRALSRSGSTARINQMVAVRVGSS